MVRALRCDWDPVWQCFSVSGPSILGTWVLSCVAELNKFNVVMDVVLRSNQTGQDNQDEYETALKGALQDMKEAPLFLATVYARERPEKLWNEHVLAFLH